MENPPALTEFFTFLTDQGYLTPEVLPEGRYKAILPLMYTHAIVVGRLGDETGYDDRWCFKSLAEARGAFEAWGGTGEPEGWVRHPTSGRRRPEGIPELEYVNP